jgi:hypothetical protein
MPSALSFKAKKLRKKYVILKKYFYLHCKLGPGPSDVCFLDFKEKFKRYQNIRAMIWYKLRPRTFNSNIGLIVAICTALSSFATKNSPLV